MRAYLNASCQVEERKCNNATTSKHGECIYSYSHLPNTCCQIQDFRCADLMLKILASMFCPKLFLHRICIEHTRNLFDADDTAKMKMILMVIHHSTTYYVY